MSAEKNRETVRRLVDELYNKGNLGIVDELFAPGFVGYDPASVMGSSGREALKEDVRQFRTAFPDSHVKIEEILAEGERVVYRWTSRSTHKGPFMDLPPTGKEVTISGIQILRFSGDRIVEGYSHWDALGLLRQLGVVPPMERREERAA